MLIGICVIPIAIKNYKIIDIVFFTSNFYQPIILIPLIVGFMGIKIQPFVFYIAMIVSIIFTLGGAYIDQKFSVFSASVGMLGSFMCFTIAEILRVTRIYKSKQSPVAKIIKQLSDSYNSLRNTELIVSEYQSLVVFPLLYLPILVFYIKYGTVLYITIVLSIAFSISLLFHEYWLKYRTKLLFYKTLLIVLNLVIFCALASYFYSSKGIFFIFIITYFYILAVTNVLQQYLSFLLLSFFISIFANNYLVQTVGLNKGYDFYFILYLIFLSIALTLTKIYCHNKQISFYKKYVEKLEQKYRNQNIPVERLEAKMRSEEKYFKIMERYEKLIKLKNQLSTNEWNKLNKHFVQELESISSEEIIKDIKSFIGIFIDQKKINILFSMNKSLFSFSVESIFLYQIFFSLVFTIIDLARLNSTIKVLISEKQEKFYLEIKYKSYIYSEEELLDNFGNKNFINPYILNLSDIIMLLKARGLIYKITEVEGEGVFSILQSHEEKNNVLAFKK